MAPFILMVLVRGVGDQKSEESGDDFVSLLAQKDGEKKIQMYNSAE